MDDLTKLAELRRAATPGPWRQGTGVHDNWVNEALPIDAVGIAGERKDLPPLFTGQVSSRSGIHVADAAFIAAAGSVPPETWEALARVVEAARDVQHEWDQLGPTGDANTLAAHRALREALAALEK